MSVFREASPGDYPWYVRLFPDLRTPDEPPSRSVFERDIVPAAFVLTIDSIDAGFAYVQVLDGVGYVRQVFVDPVFRGRRLGVELMRECARRFRAAGATSWCLNVLPDNEPAVALYRRCGLEQAYASVAVRIAWARVGCLMPGSGTVADASLDIAEQIDAAFDLPSGLAAAQIRHPERIVRVVSEAGELRGFAAFDPAFPGCFPFRARGVPAMRALLDGLRAHARPEHDSIQLVFEDSPELAAALEDAGGIRTMDFVHFRGALAEAP